MNLSATQIVLIMVVGFILFGNIPKRIEEIKKGIELVKGDGGNK